MQKGKCWLWGRETSRVTTCASRCKVLRTTQYFSNLLPKVHNFKVAMRKISEKPGLEVTQQNWKLSSTWKTGTGRGELWQSERVWWDMTTKCSTCSWTCAFFLEHKRKRGICRIIGKIWIGSEQYYTNFDNPM